ncbi:MAG TPA: ABC transporter ATP-binding protein [Sumerlaeia bacterium]|nr:ABC transporter ATP-binding protein [Sumerlaeia bacterium]
MNEPLLELEDVHFSYGEERRVLCGLDFRLGPGEHVGLVGGNGCGKTTFLRLLVGLIKPTAGTVRVFGKARRQEGDFHEVRRRVGLVFQDADDQLFCPTVLEDVAFGPLNLGQSREQAGAAARETLRGLGLEGFEDRVTYHLSGGEKRLVSLATVLAMKPHVLLLDEPTGGLDAEAAQRVIETVSGLPYASIIVSHDSNVLDGLTNRVLALRDGRLAER